MVDSKSSAIEHEVSLGAQSELKSTTTGTAPPAQESREGLIEKASRFLEDGEIRTASDQRKRQFLETKGLTKAEIEDLLNKKSSTEMVNAESEAAEPLPAPGSPVSEKQKAENSAGDNPPIITYPEFLLRTQKPAPLVTTQRLLAATYVAGGAAAAMYGLNNYLLQPMAESMSSARHSFFETAQSATSRLNEKLCTVVSKIPDVVEGAEEDSEDGEDPSRYFTRTIATQTLPESEVAAQSDTKIIVKPVLQEHSTNLTKLNGLLVDAEHVGTDTLSSLDQSVNGLTQYLNELPTFGKTGVTQAAGSTGTTPDAIIKVRSEIKAVKGTLLSARNFPSLATTR